MPADVSNLVNLLATQPGKQVGQLGETLLAAQEGVREREQQEFENQVATRKQQLEEAVATQKMSMNEVEMAAKRGELVAQTAQGILSSQDPLIRQQILQNSAPVLLKAGVLPEQIQAGMQNLDNPQFWTSVQAMGVGANQYWKTASSTGKEPTVAARKKQELIDAAKARGEYTPAYERVAEGIAYNTIKQFQDPNTGDILVRDNRGILSPSEQALYEQESAGQPAYGQPDLKRVVKGTKPEIRLQQSVKELTDDMNKTGVPRLENVLESIESVLVDTYGLGTEREGEGDVPGVGATALAPDWAVSTQAQDLRQSAIKLFNIELAERSGAAVTKQELDRLKDEFKSGAWRTDRQFVEGIKSYRSLLEDYKKAVFAGYGDDVKGRYWDQGGLALKQKIAPPTEKPIPQTTQPTEEQIRADAKKYNWSEEQVEAAIKQYVRQ